MLNLFQPLVWLYKLSDFNTRMLLGPIFGLLLDSKYWAATLNHKKIFCDSFDKTMKYKHFVLGM